MSRIFIIGAGYVAGKAALDLHLRGHQVRLGKRRPDSGLPADLPRQIRVERMDVGLPGSFPQALGEADVIIYCVSSDGFSPQQYRSAYVDGMHNVLHFLASAGLPPVVRKLIFVSSTGVFSQEDGQRVDEASATEPKSFSGQLMLEAEALLRAFARRHPAVQACAIRFSGIYGPGRTRMVEEIRAGKPVSAKRWQQFTNRIHRDDCAGALVHLVERERLLATYVASDLQPARFGEIAEWLSQTLGTPPPAILPDDGASQPAVNASPPRSAGLERGGHKQCWSTALLAEGFQFKYPGYRQGYAAFIGTATGNAQ